jgi:Fur family transcriptional regulator, ferric uptake regulator
MRNILKEKGFSATPARLAIMKIFTKSKIPLNASALHRKLSRLKINTNEATVYRTLSAFEEAEIVRKVDLRKDSIHFELTKEHHHHIICTNCNTMEDFKNFEIEKAIHKIAERVVEKSSRIGSKFKSIKEHSLELFGLCERCT